MECSGIHSLDTHFAVYIIFHCVFIFWFWLTRTISHLPLEFFFNQIFFSHYSTVTQIYIININEQSEILHFAFTGTLVWRYYNLSMCVIIGLDFVLWCSIENEIKCVGHCSITEMVFPLTTSALPMTSINISSFNWICCPGIHQKKIDFINNEKKYYESSNAPMRVILLLLYDNCLYIVNTKKAFTKYLMDFQSSKFNIFREM